MDHTSIERRAIARRCAQAMVEAALQFAAEQQLCVAVAVVDADGQLVAFARDDGCPSPVGDFARDKAWTAGTLGKSSRAFGERMASKPTLSLGLSTRERLLAWGGGVAIIEAGRCIGGIGVSGAAEDEDIECAESAVRALGLSPG